MEKVFLISSVETESWGMKSLASALRCAKWQNCDLNSAPLAALTFVLSQRGRLNYGKRQVSIGGRIQQAQSV